MLIFVWPDYSWMDEDDWRRSDESGFDVKSDDYISIDIPDDVQDIDQWLLTNRSQVTRRFMIELASAGED